MKISVLFLNLLIEALQTCLMNLQFIISSLIRKMLFLNNLVATRNILSHKRIICSTRF